MDPISRRALLQAVLVQSVMTGIARGQARVVAKPKPLPAGAVTDDWAAFLGPTHNAVTSEPPSASPAFSAN